MKPGGSIADPACGRPIGRPHLPLILTAIFATAAFSAAAAKADYVTVNGHALWYRCEGHGRPTIVLEAGSPDPSTVWASVEPALAGLTRVCVYDRAGIGRSAPPPAGERTGITQVTDLRTLLTKAAVPGPYILVGHSWGGLLARLFAFRYRHSTAGLVLLDATTFPYGAPPRLPGHTTTREGIDIAATMRQADGVSSFGHLPLIVLGHGHPPLNTRFITAQDAEAGLSDDSVDAIATKSNHYIQALPPNGQPAVVIDAVRAVVDAARRHKRLPPCRKIFAAAAVTCR